jgi:hypothetical protein
MPQSSTPISLENALKCKDISKWDFYEAVTRHDWFNEPLLSMGEIHPFKFTSQNRDQIYELVKKLRRYYEQTYKPEDNVRQYYCSQCDRIDKAYQTGKVRKQKTAIRDLLTAIVLD